MIDIRDMIKQSLDKRETERQQMVNNVGYMVQYLPCGHVREIAWNEFDLVAKAKANTHIDALVQHSKYCPECKAYQAKRRVYYAGE